MHVRFAFFAFTRKHTNDNPIKITQNHSLFIESPKKHKQIKTNSVMRRMTTEERARVVGSAQGGRSNRQVSPKVFERF